LHSLGTKKFFPLSSFAGGNPFLPPSGESTWVLNVVIGNVVALDPGAKVAVGHVILGLAGADTISAADAFGQVDQHAPPMLAHGVVGGGLRSSGQNVLPGDGSGRQQQKHMATGDGHFVPPAAELSMTGLCGWWQVSQGMPEEWSAEATWGKFF